MPEVAVPLVSLISDGARQLRSSGIAEPRREAMRIWSDISGHGPVAVALSPERPVDEVLAADFGAALARRVAGEPLAHVTGQAGFRHLLLRSDARALIPRPETEGLVELLLQRTRTGRVIDVGTGTGCIALSLAQEGTFSQVLAVDHSAPALGLARINSESLGLPVTLVRGDLCRPFRHAQFDALISNPPYLTEAEYVALDSSVRRWEPEVALVSGTDGMTATERLLDEGRDVLRPGAWLALEVDCTRAARCAALAGASGWEDVSVHSDLFGRERYLLARRSNTR
jgi:release factor glutamine methyltransferase